MLVLGLSALEHDSAACAHDKDGLLAAVEEDKLARTPAIGGIPQLAMEQCARIAGMPLAEIPVVALAGRPYQAWLREERFRLGLLMSHPAAVLGTGSVGRIYKGVHYLRSLRKTFGEKTQILQFEHNLCHAASAFYCSPFDKALVLTLDESGDMLPGLVAWGEGNVLRPLKQISFPNSFGWFYSCVTDLLGFRPRRDEHKTQWLGKDSPADFLPVFRKIFNHTPEGLPRLNRQCFRQAAGGRWGLALELLRELGVSGARPPQDPKWRAAIARSAQELLEESIVALAENFRKKTGAKYLAVAGGVFLNVLLVHALETRAGFEKVFVQPVTGNPDTSLGAAQIALQRMGKLERQELTHLFLGPEFDSMKVKVILDNCKVVYRYLPTDSELISEAVQMLQRDKIVAWYQGRLEFGLRALGNRSILASPFSPFVIENLNQYIKHREDFHPFALSVPADRAGELFAGSDNCRFMASVASLKQNVKGMDQFTFNGRDVRVHTVEKKTNPRFHELLRRFGEVAPAPVLVNTSFNLFGEPLVCDPRQAVRSFYCAGIDVLVAGNFISAK